MAKLDISKMKGKDIINLPASEIGKLPTAQQKMIKVAENLGIPGIAEMQGTTRMIYDTLPLDGRTTFRFFENNNRTFPRTNMQQGGGLLGIGECLIVELITFSVITFDAVLTDLVTNVRTLAVAALPGMYRSDLSMEIANSTAFKSLNLANMLPAFNKSSFNATNETLRMRTDLVIPPQQPFWVQLQSGAATTLANNQLCCTIEGLGSIFSANTTI